MWYNLFSPIFLQRIASLLCCGGRYPFGGIFLDCGKLVENFIKNIVDMVVLLIYTKSINNKKEIQYGRTKKNQAVIR